VVECPVCLRDVQVPPDACEGDIILCPYCKVEFQLVWVNGQWEGVRVVEAAR
jgi:hypothetical protein